MSKGTVQNKKYHNLWKKSKRGGGSGPKSKKSTFQENYGLFPQIMVFFILNCPLRKVLETSLCVGYLLACLDKIKLFERVHFTTMVTYISIFWKASLSNFETVFKQLKDNFETMLRQFSDSFKTVLMQL